MTVMTQHYIAVGHCRAHPDRLYVYGDNMLHRGKAGQAAIRDEPNAVGVPTKWAPRTDRSAYISDDDHDLQRVKDAVTSAVQRLRAHAMAAGVVVLPTRGIGTGLANLPACAPRFYAWLCEQLESIP